MDVIQLRVPEESPHDLRAPAEQARFIMSRISARDHNAIPNPRVRGSLPLIIAWRRIISLSSSAVGRPDAIFAEIAASPPSRYFAIHSGAAA